MNSKRNFPLTLGGKLMENGGRGFIFEICPYYSILLQTILSFSAALPLFHPIPVTHPAITAYARPSSDHHACQLSQHRGGCNCKRRMRRHRHGEGCSSGGVAAIKRCMRKEKNWEKESRETWGRMMKKGQRGLRVHNTLSPSPLLSFF